MKRCATLLLTVLLGASPAIAAAGEKIGVVDTPKVAQATTAGMNMQAALRSYIQIRQRLLDDDEAELKGLEDQLRPDAAPLTPEARQAKEELFRRKMSEYQRKLAQLNQEVEVKKRELFEEFNKQLSRVVQAIAEQEHCLIVFREEGMGTDDFVLYHTPTLDLTSLVIQAFAKEKKEP